VCYLLSVAEAKRLAAMQIEFTGQSLGSMTAPNRSNRAIGSVTASATSSSVAGGGAGLLGLEGLTVAAASPSSSSVLGVAPPTLVQILIVTSLACYPSIHCASSHAFADEIAGERIDWIQSRKDPLPSSTTLLSAAIAAAAATQWCITDIIH
jgi:hypothetical protein